MQRVISDWLCSTNSAVTITPALHDNSIALPSRDFFVKHAALDASRTICAPKFFITRENLTRDKAVKNFFDTYFVYTQLSKELIYRSAPYRPYTGSGKNLPKYYRKSIDNFWGTSNGKKEIRKRIQQYLTVRDAIKLVTLHKDKPTLFKSEAEKHWKKIKQKYLNDLEREKENVKVIEWDKYESLPEKDEESVQELLYDEAMCAVGFYFAELVRIAPYYTEDTMES